MNCYLRLCYKLFGTFLLPRKKPSSTRGKMCSANSNTLPPSYLGGVGASTKCQCGRFFSRDFLREQAQHGRRHAILRQCLEGPILGLRIRREEVFVFPVAFLFEVLERNEAERRGVNAIAESGRGGPVGEDVAKVGIPLY